MYVQLFDSGIRLNVAIPGGNRDATLSPVLLKSPPSPPLGEEGVSTAGGKRGALLWLIPPFQDLSGNKYFLSESPRRFRGFPLKYFSNCICSKC